MDGGRGRPGWGVFFSDWELASYLTKKMAQQNSDLSENVSLYVMDNRVLAIGVLQSREQKERLSAFLHLNAQQSTIEERTVFAEKYPLSVRMHDTWIEKKIEIKLLCSSVSSHNFDVVVFNGNAYVMGVALTDEEKEKVLTIIKETNDVDSVEDFIRLVDKEKEPDFALLRKKVGVNLQKEHDKQRKVRGIKEDDIPSRLPKAVRSTVEVIPVSDD